jgi:hypothetical protein
MYIEYVYIYIYLWVYEFRYNITIAVPTNQIGMDFCLLTNHGYIN